MVGAGVEWGGPEWWGPVLKGAGVTRNQQVQAEAELRARQGFRGWARIRSRAESDPEKGLESKEVAHDLFRSFCWRFVKFYLNGTSHFCI